MDRCIVGIEWFWDKNCSWSQGEKEKKKVRRFEYENKHVSGHKSKQIVVINSNSDKLIRCIPNKNAQLHT